jgi:23S rRNA pseudouridine1911/1915/1917 synthase
VRLDLAVARAFGLSRRAARDAVRAGRVDAGGAPVDEPGADVDPEKTKIELHAHRPARRRVRTRLAVLHEDGDVVIVDKPAGLLTVPTEARERDTLWSRVLFYLQHRYGGRPYAGIVHRLDKETSGAVVFARNREALHFLQDRFREHAIDREYVALVAGSPPEEGSYDRDLVREAGLRRRVAEAGQEGRRAVTHYRTLERLPGATLVAARLETGRTHQIRVHFSAAGHPVLGDRVYGPREARGGAVEAPRQMLHARTLGFPHPATGRRVAAEAPLPDDFREVLERLRELGKHRPGKAAQKATARREAGPSGHPGRKAKRER